MLVQRLWSKMRLCGLESWHFCMMLIWPGAVLLSISLFLRFLYGVTSTYSTDFWEVTEIKHCPSCLQYNINIIYSINNTWTTEGLLGVEERMHMHTHRYTCTTAHLWKSEDKQVFLLSFHLVWEGALVYHCMYQAGENFWRFSCFHLPSCP